MERLAAAILNLKSKYLYIWFFRNFVMNLNTRKSQGMPINVIIIAALALVVFIVLVVIFTGRIGPLAKDLESCGAKQGRCDKECGPNEATVPSAKCDKKDNKDQVCCITIFKKSEESKTIINPNDQKAGP